MTDKDKYKKINRLNELAKRLEKLTNVSSEDFQPSLATWYVFLHNVLSEIYKIYMNDD